MTTAQHPHVRDRDRVNVSDYADDELIRQLRDANQHRAGQPGGFLWFFHRAPDDNSCALHAGVRDDLGVLQWFDNDGGSIFLPGGSNVEDADYFSTFGHHFPMDPGTEVPVEMVFSAVAEFARTGQRPTCVEWQPEEQGPQRTHDC